ncbi:MAG: hypothetical protein KDD33_07780 [Bdellovibrionales bacterium]|nr:hypothetical protein [Bdellovibrionales bacterium]
MKNAGSACVFFLLKAIDFKTNPHPKSTAPGTNVPIGTKAGGGTQFWVALLVGPLARSG